MPVFITRTTDSGVVTNYCRDTSLFFSKLAQKLLDMSIAIDKRIEKIKSEAYCKPGEGVFLASIEAPVMTVAIKYEFIEYIKQYGPPVDGKFDEEKLQLIREELGITNNNPL